MSTTKALHVNGIVPIVPTPFTIEEQIDWRLVDCLRNKACAMCLPAYASQFYKLSESERLQLVAEACSRPRAGSQFLRRLISSPCPNCRDRARGRADGVSAIAAAVPRMFAFGEPDLSRYFDRLLSSIDIPLMI